MSDLRDRMIPLRAAVDAATEAAIGAMARDLAPTQRGAPLTSLARSCSEGGKRFRGILAHVGHCLARGGPLDEAPVAPLSAALELYQASALAHDDIIDHARTRRGRPTPHVCLAAHHRDRAWRGDPDRFGEAGAILVGDLLFSWAEAAMADQAGRLAPRDAARLWARYSRMHAEVALGQFLDVAAEQAPLDPGDPGAMDTEAAMEVVVRKSARYSIVHPAALGAICGGADDALIAAIESILTPWGMAFQLRDDHLGVFGDPELTGKPSGDDIREGKRTVLLALAWQRATDSERAVLCRALGRADAPGALIDEARQVIAARGGDAHEELITSLVEQGRAHLREAPVSEQGRADLVGLCGIITRRAA